MCSNPAHRSGVVVRAGWHGVAPHRRQRWLCKPANGDKQHRFSEPLPRQEREGSHCSECSSALDPWEGQAGARNYAFHARDIAHALMLVALGVSYRQAAKSTRTAARRGSSGVTWGQRVPRMRQRVVDGQLVANWVDVFGPVATWSHGRTYWPERMAVDSVEFQVGGVRPRSFHVMVAVGYEQPHFREPKVWLMRPFTENSQEAWEEFFGLLPGTPRRIVADMDRGILAAVASSFPRRNEPAPTYHWSDLHVSRRLHNAVAPLHNQPNHVVMKRLDDALRSTSDWDRLVHAIHHEDQTATPMPAAIRWLRLFGARVRDQAANRDRGPYSTGAVETVNFKLAQELIGERANRLGNRKRLIKLLDLLTVGLNGHANERAFAKVIRLHLEGHAGRPLLRQRPHDDHGGPSLYT